MSLLKSAKESIERHPMELPHVMPGHNQQLSQFRGGHWLAEQITSHDGNAIVDEKTALAFCFHAFRRRAQIKAFGHCNDVGARCSSSFNSAVYSRAQPQPGTGPDPVFPSADSRSNAQTLHRTQAELGSGRFLGQVPASKLKIGKGFPKPKFGPGQNG